MPLSERQLIRDVAGERTFIEIKDDSNYSAYVEIKFDGERWELGIDRERVPEVLDRDASEVCPE